MVAPSKNRPALDAARHARDLLDAHQPRAALAIASRALRGGEDATLRLMRARALLAFRADDEAERDLARCLKLDVRCAGAYQLLCELALRRGELAAAELFLRDALRLAPTELRNIELARVVQGWKQARAAASRARAGQPGRTVLDQLAA